MIRGARRGIELKTPDQLKLMRKAGLVVARALTATCAEVRPGITTGELDQIAADVIAQAGATPSFLNYGADRDRPGFPGVVCISVNSEVVHGIPGGRTLRAGDVVSIDCGAIVDGWHGDAARTVFAGEPATEHRALGEVTHGALWRGIAAARLGGRIGEIGAAVEDYASGESREPGPGGERPGGYGIVEDYVGHGIGSAMHQPPDVCNYRVRGRTPRIVRGLCLAIEPMLTLGSPDSAVLDDDWTVVTRDGQPAAHWEHTITVTEHGTWVLTAEDGGEAMLRELGVAYGPLAA